MEKEVGFRIFDRGRSGVSVTEQGEELLSDIRTIYEQMAAVQNKYIEKRPDRKTFSVSIQHFSPAGEAAMRLLSQLEEASYIVKFLEGRTTEVIADVASGRSEIGFLHFPDEKEPGILRDLRNEKMEFYSIRNAEPRLLLRKIIRLLFFLWSAYRTYLPTHWCPMTTGWMGLSMSRKKV